MATRANLPRLATFKQIPWWAWTGGACGACIVMLLNAARPKIGGMALVFMVVGTMLAGLLIDQYGLFGGARYPITPGRLVGLVLLIAGVAILKRF